MLKEDPLKMTGGETPALVSALIRCTCRTVVFNVVLKLRFIAALVQRGSLEATEAVGSLERPGWLSDGVWLCRSHPAAVPASLLRSSRSLTRKEIQGIIVQNSVSLTQQD